VTFDLDRTERIIIEVGEPLLPQKHACVQHPIFFDNMNTGGKVTPPIVGRHRERWPKWGEYDYIPPQRWLHGSEHGAIVFLYHHCLDAKSLCRIRQFIQKWRRWVNKGKLPGGKFRFILTPFKDLQRPFAMSSWGELYMSRGFHETEMDMFVEKHYRRSWEDYAPDGTYDYLWADVGERAAACSSSGPAPENEEKYGDIPGSVGEIQMLKHDLAVSRVLSVSALIVALLCLLALVLLWMRLKGGGHLYSGYEDSEGSTPNS